MPTTPRGALAIAERVAYWTMPPGVTKLLHSALRRRLGVGVGLSEEERPILERNRELQRRHRGQRCFILATGPSIEQQNLSLLEGELCISVANFFVHPEFARIRPRYHCIAPLHPPFTDEDGVRWFRAMERHMENTAVVLSYSDKRLVEANDLFIGCEVRYLRFGADWADVLRTSPDLSRRLPGPQSVSIMALMVALYLGCKEIYMLGVDHTSFSLRTGTFDYRHFYNKGANLLGEMPAPPDLESQFAAAARLWRQYKVLREVANTEGTTIYNATTGGVLDLFPRVRLEDVLCKPVTDPPA